MKNRKSLTVTCVGLVMFAMLCMGSPAFAVITYNGLDVVQIGKKPSDSATNSYTVQLRGTEWNYSKWYYLSSELGEGGYATFLTALTLDRTVTVTLEGYQQGSIITDVNIEPN